MCGDEYTVGPQWYIVTRPGCSGSRTWSERV
jgi:hypothetical protein